MAFLTEPEPPRGVALDALPGIRRIVAPNPGVMTCHGTNTYLVDDKDGTLVVDPGPEGHGHVAAILSATDGRVSRILLTHRHRDHLGALPALRAATGATTYAFRDVADQSFDPEIELADGDTVGPWTAMHTPGHAPDHLCFARADGVVLTGDHIMSFSTTVVSPPLGDMSRYFGSLRRMLARPDTTYLPGHGPVLHGPQRYVAEMIERRQEREDEILRALAGGLRAPEVIARSLYHKQDPVLQFAAERNVLAHLIKLETEGRAVRIGDAWHRS